ncbi:MAG: hypothetical protein HY331_01485 [Chloroflexi bacterium]|nr:hypothetical protein [Chloroflexota bacterium]
MTSPTETLTIRLPVAAVRRLRRVAEISGRPVDQVIAETLGSSLPPLLEDVPVAFHRDLASLEALTNEELRQQVHVALAPEHLARYDELLAANAVGQLDQAGQEDLTMMRWQADRLMFRKAYAALLLRWRGEHPNARGARTGTVMPAIGIP